MIRAKCIGAAAVAALMVSYSLPAEAQTALEDSIANRVRPTSEPIGMVVGPYDSFLLFPKFQLDTEITDNLFAVETDKSADITLLFKPSVEITSDWDNHNLKFIAKAEQAKSYTVI